MKRTILFIALLFGLTNLSFGKEVNVATAKKVGITFLKENGLRENPTLSLVYQDNFQAVSAQNKTQTDNAPLFYLFSEGNDKGFIIVSGDDNAIPILGYAITGTFDPDNMAPNFRKWLDGYKQELRYIVQNDIRATPGIRAQWNAYKSGVVPTPEAGTKKADEVEPLLETTWNQSPHYNALCPGGSVTGCVATAMAQIMKYWSHPAQGTGFHSYNHNEYGTQSANFGATTYDWASMPTNVSSANSAVATLMFHCGVSVDMGYSPSVSGAWVIEASPNPTANAEYAFKTYFGYDNTLQGVERKDYTTIAWINLLKGELDAGRPIDYAGFGSGGGHAFVCDGYDDNNFFHFNWGWGGAFDGYFSVDAMNPSGTGTGGGTGGYNSGQQAVIGIQPAGAPDVDLVLNGNLMASPGTVNFGQAFDITADILNNGATTFDGDYAVAVFDANNNFVDFVEVKTGFNLTGGAASGSLTFSSAGISNMMPGAYLVGVFYRPVDGDWKLVGNGSFTNLVPLTVTNANQIELNSAFFVTPGAILIQGEPASVTLDILNNGGSTYLGSYAVDLYDLDGNWIEEIGSYSESTGLGSGMTYPSPFLSFSTPAITAAPGTYFLALTHAPSGGNWEIGGSSFFENPVFVTVQAPGIDPDIYESNDTEASAYEFPVNFSGDNATVQTIGSNGHTGDDFDYYKIELPAGFDYEISGRAHDSYNSGNGQTYTDDVLWSYAIDGVASTESYDDILPAPISVNNGGTVVFLVAPYFQGEKGTYLLDLQITRTGATAIENELEADRLKTFPNPAKDWLFLESDQEVLIDQISVMDINGKQVKSINILDRPAQIAIPVEELAPGVYFLLVKAGDKSWNRKFIKSN